MELIDYNPRIGRWTFVEDDHATGESVIREVFRETDAKAVVDRTRYLQNHGLGRGEDMRLHCSVPYVVLEGLRQYGIDYRNSDHWPAMFAKLRVECPHLFVNT